MMPLALVGLVLLSTVPTLGRIASAAPAASTGAVQGTMHATHDMAGNMSDADMASMPMHAGMSMHHAAMPHGSGHDAKATMPTREAADPHAGHAVDCDYCPLLQSLLGALAVALLAMPAIDLPRPRFDPASAILPWHHPYGLGSRGPPHAS